MNRYMPSGPAVHKKTQEHADAISLNILDTVNQVYPVMHKTTPSDQLSQHART